MTVLRLDEILAQTDPFDLSQGVERHVSTLDGTTIRELVAPVLDRAGKYYRNELSFLLDPGLSDEAVRRSFIRFLTSNLRAISLFGSGFGDAVLKACPQHRVAAIGEERSSAKNARAFVMVGTAVALVILGAAAEHAVTNAKAAAQAPQPSARIAVPIAVARATPAPRRRAAVSAPLASPSQLPAATEPPVSAVDATPAANTFAHPASPTQYAAPPAYVQPSQSHFERPHPSAPPAAKGAVVNIAPPTPAPEATPIDTTDMPESYSDATPLPKPSDATADPQTHDVTVPTPKPTERPRHGVFNHLDPFQPGSHFRIP